MKAIFISDTHNKLHLLNPNDYCEVDFIFHCGDFTATGLQGYDVHGFLYNFPQFKAKHKVAIAGNHELGFLKDEDHVRELFKERDLIYLRDESIELEGYKIYGTPWQKEFMNWEFNLPKGSKELKEKFDAIPVDTDILITHAPPYSILDYAYDQHLGEPFLYNRIKELKNLKIHSFGHIHEATGKEKIEGVWFLNAALMNGNYQPQLNRVYIACFDDDKNCILLEEYNKANEELYSQF
jgi:Icc-related predicted phosphoesterase